jgi:(1->4)-alpha-D-glucan 1-alpha-D-glucosylmutase|nr:malto-oligosyltrehalose synthase [Kofleriaceae bacterium]
MAATYRLQLRAGVTFEHARELVPYLAELGVTHLYLSPILQAADGSTHGYDVVDAERVDASLGGDAGFRELVGAARAADLALLLDVVPNHMSIDPAAGSENRWWLDVLENGVASYYAHYFDVDWPAGDDRVALPVLGERYGRAIAGGQLGVIHDGTGGFAVRAGELRLPMAPRAIGALVKRAAERCHGAELAFVGDALVGLSRARDAESRRRRHRDKAVLRARLAALCGDPACAAAIDAELAALATDPVELDALLEAQAYQLVHWSVSGSQLTYRRFFDVSTLVGLRAELDDVFAASHARIVGWLADGTLAGVRVDHVDGLRDPAAYLARLRAAAPGSWVVVEKIVAGDERLPDGWQCDGTTGYEFIDRVTSLLVDPAGEQAMTDAFTAYTGDAWDPAAASRAARREVMSDALHSELSRLVELAGRACAQSIVCRDFTRAEIEHALVELLCGFRVYRTYSDERAPRELDRARLAAAAATATGVDPDLLGFLVKALGFEIASAEARELAAVAQQVTGAILAKGDEDTLAYRQVRLAARCEVGCDVGVFAREVGEVHALLAAAPARGLLATATHDTKRGEDTRARLAALSEVPAAWTAAVARWRARGDVHWGDVAPDRVLEYLLWQTLVGAWPLTEDRLLAYAHKASREARLRTSWRKPDDRYEAAMTAWCRGVLADRELVADVERFVAQLAPRAAANSLAQLAIKLTAPGVPDIYQGCELADYALVDPDNRRPVDFAARRTALAAVRGARASEIARDLGLAKLWLAQRVLGLRRREPERFGGTYAPLVVTGSRFVASEAGPGTLDRVFAFARGDALAVAVSIRGDASPETALALPVGRWRDALDDRRQPMSGRVPISELWRDLPVAVLVRT